HSAAPTALHSISATQATKMDASTYITWTIVFLFFGNFWIVEECVKVAFAVNVLYVRSFCRCWRQEVIWNW
ncbi:hypothetical protein ACSTKO_24460, partial [Vibrio parahaemolyticus]